NFEEAQARMERYKRLSPLDPHAFFYDTCFITTAFLRRDYENAATVARATTEMNPSFTNALKPYLAALGYLDFEQETASVRTRLLALEPRYTVEQFLLTTPIERDEDRMHYAIGLRRAGVPAGDIDIAAG
ncbi:MAG: hypothetical protein ACKVQA_10120, partial [Burkholderiales bacterium]